MNQTTATNQAAATDQTVAKTADDIESLLDDAQAAVAAAQHGAALSAADGPERSGTRPYQLDDLRHEQPADELPAADDGSRSPNSLDLLGDVQLDLRIELGRTVMRLDDVLRLRRGSVVALDKLAGDPVDIYINGRLIAHGEVLVLNDHFCVRVTELVGHREP